ncbi:SLAP domain-containing protein [Companilactobacillus nodensis]|uniref:Pesticidal crystal protein Cry22Aa Ig-like domain-containing protein n=1 Tax=Companilactobacillus nodensis DSM 19682 = JCM 14932 = NBRC 107160 TaxID=1423775 RepID=A0A0R1KHZ5_9LACO|nr:SLAP domain-containing protein [Companilactobacillus nodensis]KRK79626.1 hypothetical protein FD03_GL000325 [Companilactobacillus nodensis DSM 19682 = JCM 14932 = NBRC 107160]
MSKRKIVLVATGLCAGMLVTSGIVNVPVISGTVRSEKVKAATGNKNIDIPDPKLHEALDEHFKDLDGDWTMDDLNKPTRSMNLEGYGITDLTGLEDIKVEFLYLDYNDITSIGPLLSASINQLNIGDNRISNFDEFHNLKVDLVYSSRQRVDLGTKVFTSSNLSLDLNEQFGSKKNMVNIYSIRIDDGDDLLPGEYNFSEDRILDIGSVENNKGKVRMNFKLENTFGPNDYSHPRGGIVMDYIIDTSIRINTYDTITITEGDGFDEMRGIKEFTDANGNVVEVDPSLVNIEGSVNINKAGTYPLTYTIKDNPGEGKTTVIVKEKPGTGGNSNIEDIDSKNVMTDKKEIDTYNENGKKVGTKDLLGVTNFKVTKMNTIDGTKYYQISTNEWIKESDVNEFHSNPVVIQTHHNTHTTLSTLSGNTVTNRALAANSNWYASGHVFIDGEKYYRVATNEWIHVDHGVEYEKISGVVTAKETAQLYSSKGKKTHRALMKNSKFVTDKVGTINGQTMYRVASDEWVPEELVSLN